MRPRKERIETGDKSLDRVLNASPQEFRKIVDEMAEELTRRKGGKEGLERLARSVLDGKTRPAVMEASSLDAALKKAGSEVDIYQMTVTIDVCPSCGKETLVKRRSPRWTWESLAGRGSDECTNCGYKSLMMN